MREKLQGQPLVTTGVTLQSSEREITGSTFGDDRRKAVLLVGFNVIEALLYGQGGPSSQGVDMMSASPYPKS